MGAGVSDLWTGSAGADGRLMGRWWISLLRIKTQVDRQLGLAPITPDRHSLGEKIENDATSSYRELRRRPFVLFA